ncbi:MAG: hypothetical protein B6U97_05050 [Candidatus Altiarchaeales archaeon ex4484_96]|nr:MAG: hypothetical protein B6U97_05050 [Candidatus Altiarchaeales archaeon ex4484_96]
MVEVVEEVDVVVDGIVVELVVELVVEVVDWVGEVDVDEDVVDVLIVDVVGGIVYSNAISS